MTAKLARAAYSNASLSVALSATPRSDLSTIGPPCGQVDSLVYPLFVRRETVFGAAVDGCATGDDRVSTWSVCRDSCRCWRYDFVIPCRNRCAGREIGRRPSDVSRAARAD